jgi:hypothetical protein
MTQPSTDAGARQFRSHHPGQELFRAIRSEEVQWKEFAAFPHPEDRIYTVISGVFYIGIGSEFDEAALTAHAPGSVVVLPGGQPHFHWAKSGEYITQVSAIGPLGLCYVDPAHDPRTQATILVPPGVIPA